MSTCFSHSKKPRHRQRWTELQLARLGIASFGWPNHNKPRMRTKNEWELNRRGLSHKPSSHAVTLQDLPLTEATPYQHRPGVHVWHDHEPTLWSIPHAKRKGGGFTPADTLVRTRPTEIGKEKKADAKRWRHAKDTHQVRAKHRRAQKWLAKYSHK